ncbi:MAG: adenine deaminase C-terminal domain-containing protein, partial [Eubacteriales bacterium]
LEWPEVAGLGEIYWSRILDDPPLAELLQLIEKALSLGKAVEGHGAGAKNRKLAAMAAHGVGACHEPITAAEVQERLRMGLYAMIREGSVRRELEAVIGPLVKIGLDLQRAVLVSDSVWPNHLYKYGHMDFIINKAIALGLDPVAAIRMATLNPARHFNLDGDLGGVAPGKCADLVVVSDIKNIEAGLVFCRGRLVAREGELTAGLPDEKDPPGFRKGFNLSPVSPEFFRVEAAGQTVGVRAMEMVSDIVNREVALKLPVVDGQVQAAGVGDVLKVAVIDRFGGTGRRSIGFFKGFGLRRGAAASSFSYDEGNLVVAGDNDADMAAAVNRIVELNGGVVYCRDGRVVEELPLPFFGAVSDLPGREVAARMESLAAALKEAGCRSENPLLTILTTTFTAIPSLRLLAGGYWLSKENRFTTLFY